MLGFEPLTQDITVTAEPQPSAWTLTLQTVRRHHARHSDRQPARRLLRRQRHGPPVGPGAASRATPRRLAAARIPARRRDGARPRAAPAAASCLRRTTAGSRTRSRPPDGFLINGSVNNGAASPFAQAAAFGNNRRGRGSLFNYQLARHRRQLVVRRGAVHVHRPARRQARLQRLSHVTARSAARCASVTSCRSDGPNRVHRLPARRRSQRDDAAGAGADGARARGRLLAEPRRLGQPVQSSIPLTGKPFAGNIIPASRISPQAAALLALLSAAERSAARATTSRRRSRTSTAHGSVHGARHAADQQPQPADRHARVSATSATQQTTMFGFDDASTVSGVDTSLHVDAPHQPVLHDSSARAVSGADDQSTPYFANRTNVSGARRHHRQQSGSRELGTAEPQLSRAVTGLSDALPNFNRNRNHRRRRRGVLEPRPPQPHLRRRRAPQRSSTSSRSRIRAARSRSPARSPAPTSPTSCSACRARARSRSATPTSSCARTRRTPTSTDDWRLSPTLTMQIGVRWEYESPMTRTLDGW